MQVTQHYKSKLKAAYAEIEAQKVKLKEKENEIKMLKQNLIYNNANRNEPIAVVIKTAEGKRVLLGVKCDDTIQSVLYKAKRKTEGIPKETHRLIFNNHILDMRKSLKDYQIRKGDILNLIPNPDDDDTEIVPVLVLRKGRGAQRSGSITGRGTAGAWQRARTSASARGGGRRERGAYVPITYTKYDSHMNTYNRSSLSRTKYTKYNSHNTMNTMNTIQSVQNNYNYSIYDKYDKYRSSWVGNNKYTNKNEPKPNNATYNSQNYYNSYENSTANGYTKQIQNNYDAPTTYCPSVQSVAGSSHYWMDSDGDIHSIRNAEPASEFSEDINVPDLPENYIYVKFEHYDTIKLDFETNDKIKNIKDKIESKIGINWKQQRLVFAAKVLQNNHTLQHYDIETGSTLNLWRVPWSSGIQNDYINNNYNNVAQGANTNRTNDQVSIINNTNNNNNNNIINNTNNNCNNGTNKSENTGTSEVNSIASHVSVSEIVQIVNEIENNSKNNMLSDVQNGFNSSSSFDNNKNEMQIVLNYVEGKLKTCKLTVPADGIK